MANTKLKTLRLVDLSDREVLALVDQERDYEGWVSTDHLALTIGMGGDNPRQSVSRRMSWLRRYGAVEKRREKGETKWRLTPVGDAIMRARLSPAAARMLERLSDDSLLYLSEALSEQYQMAGEVHATLARRQMQYGMQRRRLGLR